MNITICSSYLYVRFDYMVGMYGTWYSSVSRQAAAKCAHGTNRNGVLMAGGIDWVCGVGCGGLESGWVLLHGQF